MSNSLKRQAPDESSQDTHPLHDASASGLENPCPPVESGVGARIEPGMVVEASDADLSVHDISKPKVRDIIRDKQGRIKKLAIEKGLIFKKEIEVPADRIQAVVAEPETGSPQGEVTISATDEELDALKPMGTEALPPTEPAEPPDDSDDVLSQIEEAQPTAEAMARREGRNELAEERPAATAERTEQRRAGPRELLRTLGPGFLAGMAGNDSSAVTSYAVIGASTGLSQLWLLVLATPMYQAVQYACGKVGRITQQGLADLLRTHYGRWVAALVSIFLIIGNVALIAGDLSAIGSGIELFTGISWLWFVVPAALVLWYVTVFRDFAQIKKIFVVLSLAFVCYLVTGLLSGANWGNVLRHTVVPEFNFSFAAISGAVALLGATISPYTMFWQVQGEKEEQRSGSLGHQVRLGALDVASGTISGNLIAYFIIVTTAATLYTRHQTIATAAQAAESLVPVLGPVGKYLFAVGLIGAGLVAIPILLASTSYAISDTFGWHASLWHKPWQNEGFYLILSAALVVSVVLAFLGFSPIQLMFYANVLQAVLAPALVIVLLLVGNSRRIMRGYRLGALTNAFLVLAVAILAAATILLFYGLLTGQGGG